MTSPSMLRRHPYHSSLHPNRLSHLEPKEFTIFANLTGVHALVILAVVVLLFGAAKLPALAKSVGQSVRILKDETKDNATTTGTATGTAAASDTPAVTHDTAYVAPSQVQAHPNLIATTAAGSAAATDQAQRTA